MQTRIYSIHEAVGFRKTNEAFGALSNMASNYHINVNGIIVPSSEALYQACRYPLFPEIQKEIIDQDNGMKAKMISKKYYPHSRQDWDTIKVKIMRWCLQIKLSQNYSTFGEVLAATGNKPIVEVTTKDKVWGALKEGENYVGTNALGRLLMELRDQYVHSGHQILCVDPPNIVGFLLYGHPIERVCFDEFNDELNGEFAEEEYELA